MYVCEKPNKYVWRQRIDDSIRMQASSRESQMEILELPYVYLKD